MGDSEAIEAEITSILLNKPETKSIDAEISLLLSLCDDLEASPPKFEIWEQVCEISQEIELKSPHLESQLLAECPDYFDRTAKAIARLSEILPSQSELKNESDRFSILCQIENRSYLRHRS